MAKHKTRQHSKPRKLSVPPKRVPVVPELNFRDQKAFITKENLDKLRSQDEFIDLVKVMRLSDVLTYAVNLILKETGENDPVNRREHVRNEFNIGGYVYEAFRLIRDLEKRHKGKAYFSGFRKILEQIADTRVEKILRLLRNNTAFHLDHSNYSTRAALAEMGHKELEVMTAHENSYLATYFPLADDVDLNYFVDELIKFDSGTKATKLTADEESALVQESFLLVANLARDMAFESQRFIQEVSKRLGLLR